MIVFAAIITSTSLHATEPATPPLPGYRLAWSDDFDGSKLDTNKWHYRTGNRLLSFQQPKNVSATNGLLRLALKKEKAGGAQYTAGGVISREQFKYGYYEARFRCPDAVGWHTAFWTMDYTDPSEIPPGADFAQLVEQGKATNSTQIKAQEIDICEQDAGSEEVQLMASGYGGAKLSVSSALTEYTPVSLEFVSAHTAKEVVITLMHPGGPGKGYVDDVQLTRLGDAPPPVVQEFMAFTPRTLEEEGGAAQQPDETLA